MKVKAAHRLQPVRPLCPWNSPGRNTGVGSPPFPSPGDLPDPGTKPRSPILQADSLLSEPRGKPKNTGVGGLSLLQGIFPTQESNRGLLNCRRTLPAERPGQPGHVYLRLIPTDIRQKPSQHCKVSSSN